MNCRVPTVIMHSGGMPLSVALNTVGDDLLLPSCEDVAATVEPRTSIDITTGVNEHPIFLGIAMITGERNDRNSTGGALLWIDALE